MKTSQTAPARCLRKMFVAARCAPLLGVLSGLVLSCAPPAESPSPGASPPRPRSARMGVLLCQLDASMRKDCYAGAATTTCEIQRHAVEGALAQKGLSSKPALAPAIERLLANCDDACAHGKANEPLGPSGPTDCDELKRLAP